jgi:glycosyltransferase involved in cell wall biosynthesis
MNLKIFNKEILLVTSWVFPHLGGVSSHLSLLASKLSIQESDVISYKHICAEPNLFLTRIVRAAKRFSKQLMKKETVSFYSKILSTVIAEQECSIVHCHDAMATWAALRARNKYHKKYKIISTVHGPVSRHMIEEGYLPDSADVKKVNECEQEAWKGSDEIICVDEGQAEIIKSQGADPNKITIIENAVDVDKILKMANAIPITRKDEREWVLVPRRLSPKNGIEYIIRAMTFITKKPRLLLAGNGLDRERLEALVISLGLKNDVLFLGGLDHSVLLPIMSASDVIVIPSVPVHGIEEATSIAAIEAMALGKIVIASNIGGLKMLIRNQVNGILVPPADPSCLAEKICMVLADKNKSQIIGNSARKTVLEKFSVALWFDKHMEIYLRNYKTIN